MRKIVCMALVCMVLMGNLCISATAAGEGNLPPENKGNGPSVGIMASGSFNMSVSPNRKSQADKTFPLEAGETVRIYATYSPDDASVDIGLIDPDGIFHYFNVTDGTIDKTIEIAESGNYRLAVKNNSSKTVKISGFVKY
jgi:hypothetical protein